jgi:hypothetical protein
MTTKRSVLKSIFLLIVIAGLGFASKFLPFFEGTWVSNQLSGLFYVTELCIIVYLVFPGNSSWIYGLTAFLLTSVLEILQLWDACFLESIRSTFLGQTIIGSSFNWLDFPMYLLGALLGWALLQWVVKNRPMKYYRESY